MRETTQRRAETRQRILDAAGLLFREHGIDGVGVDAVMRQAGLTHGGFYLHFASKEALAAEVAQSLLEKAAARWDQASRSPDPDVALREIVLSYLSPAKIASTVSCPLTTLGPDVARRSTTRGAMAGALRGMLDALTRCIPGGTPRLRRKRAVAALATMVGAVVLARLADDPGLADEFLVAAAASVLATDQATTERSAIDRPAVDEAEAANPPG
jgi:TetR/AcrR family transcriptional repressor of nem operon